MKNWNEPDALITNLDIVARKTNHLLNIRLMKFGLTASNYYYLLKVNAEPDMSQAKLAKKIFFNQSNVTRQINQLINLDLLKKETAKHDNRTWIITLTDKGKDLIPKVKKVIEDINEQLYHGISWSRNDLIMLFEALDKNLS